MEPVNTGRLPRLNCNTSIENFKIFDIYGKTEQSYETLKTSKKQKSIFSEYKKKRKNVRKD